MQYKRSFSWRKVKSYNLIMSKAKKLKYEHKWVKDIKHFICYAPTHCSLKGCQG